MIDLENEWVIFTVLVTILSAFFLVYTPLRNSAKENEKEKLAQQKEYMRISLENTRATTELNSTMKTLSESLRTFKDDNTRSHKEFYERLDKKGRELAIHTERLDEHERRIQKLEEDRE